MKKRPGEESLICDGPRCRQVVKFGDGQQFVVNGEVQRLCPRCARGVYTPKEPTPVEQFSAGPVA